jgi:hypothetical protein
VGVKTSEKVQKINKITSLLSLLDNYTKDIRNKNLKRSISFLKIVLSLRIAVWKKNPFYISTLYKVLFLEANIAIDQFLLYFD